MVLQLQVWAFWLFQEGGGISFDPRTVWGNMGFLAKAVVILLFIMSAISIGVAIDRWIAFSAARKQSRAFAPAVAGALREGKLDEAVKIADRYNKSHLAKVVVAGLQEFKAHQVSSELSGEDIEASRRALEAGRSHCACRVKAGHQQLGDHRFHCAVRWTVRYRRWHHERIRIDFNVEIYRFGCCCRRYFRSPDHYRGRLVRRHPGSVAVQLLYEPGRGFRCRDGELQFGASRLLRKAK